jgi:hypothetical protein
MKYDFVRGEYDVSFFSMKLHVNFELDSILELPENVQELFFHEYLHFIQDITTVFGIDAAWNNFDQLRRTIKYLQEEPEPITLPIAGDKVKEILNHSMVARVLHGDMKPQIREGISTQQYNIIRLRYEKSKVIKEALPDVDIHLAMLYLENDQGVPGTFHFGVAAIIETMAFLAQRKFYPNAEAINYPYLVAKNLAAFLYPEFGDSDEWVYALCDASLMYKYPGTFFCDLLQDIRVKKKLPARTEDIYSLADEFLNERGYNIWDAFQQSKTGLEKMIEILFGETFPNERDWLITLIKEGYSMRRENMYCMLDIYRAEAGFSEALGNIWLRLGTPNMYNLFDERWFHPPQVLAESTNIHPAYLMAFNHLKSITMTSDNSCGLYQSCQGSHTPMPVNEHCKTDPWSKGKVDPLCPFGAVWFRFGLNEKEVIAG